MQEHNAELVVVGPYSGKCHCGWESATYQAIYDAGAALADHVEARHNDGREHATVALTDEDGNDYEAGFSRRHIDGKECDA